MQIHTMKLNPAAFSKIQAGTKKLELRLCDEKRKCIAVGDVITFQLQTDIHQTVQKTVKEIHYFKSFIELLESFDPHLYGSESVEEEYKKIRSIYGLEEEKDGVVAIELM